MYPKQKFGGDPIGVLRTIRDEIDILFRQWDPQNGGSGNKNNKSLTLLAQMYVGRDVRDYDEAKGILLDMVAQDYRYPGTVLHLPDD